VWGAAVHERKRKARKQSKRGKRAKVLPHSTWFACLQRQRVYKARETSRAQASAGRTQTLTERGVFSQPRLLGVLAAARAARRVSARRTSIARATKSNEVRLQSVTTSTAAQQFASALRTPAAVGSARRVAGVPAGALRVARGAASGGELTPQRVSVSALRHEEGKSEQILGVTQRSNEQRATSRSRNRNGGRTRLAFPDRGDDESRRRGDEN
jgi:hypothetical protein